jgi:hypothetical protein
VWTGDNASNWDHLRDSVQMLLKLSTQVKDESIPGMEMMVDVPYLQMWWGDLGLQIISFAVPLSILLAIPFMLAIGVAMERGLIRHFYHQLSQRKS